MKQKKYLSMILFGILFLTFFQSPKEVKAATNGYITGDVVYFRTGAGTNFNFYEALYKGDAVSLNNTNKVNGIGCSAGWYNVTYNNKTGFVCSSYVSLKKPSVTTNYNLPWTSPKKAIYGGASFIVEGYIENNQNTSYLKKYNVAPGNTPYTNQYMTNIAAPFNEAASSYKSYKENGLLNLPLHFEIPVYKNMPEYTTHPVSGKENGGTSIVKDQAFEKKLNQEGFDETYKKWLRTLHESYPNWTFKAIQTGLDFNTAVGREKLVGAVSKTCKACQDSKNLVTEAGWATPNDQTMAYFLDPRNFLMADSILMFEDLSYNENYTEKVVASVLKGTFMSGTDPIDNLSYAKIFVEAGKTYNISPVYLAALSKQEMGTKGGLAASGERFEYKGNTYEGFYNFFNIGAYSSEEDPAKAGLVYASRGSEKDATGVFKGTTPPNSSSTETPSTTPQNPPTSTTIPTATHLKQMNLNKKGNYITNITLNETVKEIKNKTKASEVTILSQSGTTLGDSEKLTTGTKIKFKNGETYTVVIYGDLTGDGAINGADLLKMRQYLLGQTTLNDSFLEAAHAYTTKGKPSGADLLKIRQHLLGKSYINQA